MELTARMSCLDSAALVLMVILECNVKLTLMNALVTLASMGHVLIKLMATNCSSGFNGSNCEIDVQECSSIHANTTVPVRIKSMRTNAAALLVTPALLVAKWMNASLILV
eukprot:m.204549 g.204549  ORF g.204549 m.204549 type:complete len:110 (+) comp39652_c0_seq1:138-467(+)